MAYKRKACLRCGKMCQPTSGKQKYCTDCGRVAEREKHNEGNGRSHDRHREEDNARDRAYTVSHREHKAALRAVYREDKSAYDAERYPVCRDKKIAYTKAYTLDHPEQQKLYMSRSKSKRRVLGFLPLNQPFAGSEGHHMDRERVIFIPKKLHRSVGHDVWNGRNMDKINAIADEWLVSADFEVVENQVRRARVKA